MIALIQRVSHANVAVAGEVIAQIERGLVVLVGVARGDSEREAEKLGRKPPLVSAVSVNCGTRSTAPAISRTDRFIRPSESGKTR